MRRSKHITVLAAIAAVVLVGTNAMAATDAPNAGRFDRPHEGFAPATTVLHDGEPEDVGLDPDPIKKAEGQLDSWTQPDESGHPLFSGAVGLLAHDGVVVDEHATGGALRYADASGNELPADQQVPMRDDTIFDMASVTKLFTSIAVLQLSERGDIDVDAPAARYLPDFGANGKESITIKQLLTHTSGLPADPEPPLWSGQPDIPSRRIAVLNSAPVATPGTAYEYSDINLMSLGFLVEKITGSTLDEVVKARITEPLGMSDTGYHPPKSKLDRIAATEYSEQPPRGLIRGEVHDENAWALGGTAGHAGIFSTARDMSVLGQAIINGGSYNGNRILGQGTTRSMLTNYNQKFPEDSHGLGFELDQRWYMDGLTSQESAGHTGFTGTSLVLDPKSRSVVVLLTNRVHPTREWGSNNVARQAWARGMASALAVRPRHGDDAWYSGIGNNRTATLDTRALRPRGPVTAHFDAFVDTEATDPLVLEATDDGQRWHQIPMRIAGAGAPDQQVDALAGSGHRQWWTVSADVPESTQLTLRWRSTTDANYSGRGIYLDNIRISDDTGVLLDGENDPSELTASGWELRDR